MSGMKKKTSQTSKSTKSGSKKPKQHSMIHSTEKPPIAVKTMQAKKDLSSLAKASKTEILSSSSASAQKLEPKKSSELFPPGNRLQKKKESLKDSLVHELSEADILKLKLVDQEKITRSRKAKSFRIKDRERQEIKKADFLRRAGRPPKPSELKEKNHIVRFSDQFLRILKKRAELAGFAGWQTYLKSVVAQEIGFSDGL